MSAWMGGGADFLRWLEARFPGAYEGGSYAPRMVYADYLREIRDDVRAALGDRLVMDTARATGARWRRGVWELALGDGRAVAATHLVLATGNPPPAAPGWPADHRFIPDFWAWRFAGGTFADAAAPAVIIGTGLSAVDAVMSLRADGYRGVITAVSPHGRFPMPHAAEVPPYRQAHMMIAAMMNNRTARGYLRILRAHIRSLPEGQWRSVINALRERTVMLWQALPAIEKGRFMRHLCTLWNIHRHRMAPDIHARLAADSALTVIAGRVRVDEGGQVALRRRGADKWRALPAGTVVNCTGPDYRRMVADNPVLADLAANGQLAAGPLGLGVATPVAPGLHVIGTALLGERLETTAVPDLRQQAAGVATRIAATL
jgi:hydroxyacylglutathione hydrolase